MSCDGGHLGFPIGIKNRNLVKDIPMIIHLQFGFSQFISFRKEDLWNFSQSEHIIGPGSHVEYPTGTKNINFVEDHPRNIPAKFGSNWPSGFGEEAWNVKSLQTTDNRRRMPSDGNSSHGPLAKHGVFPHLKIWPGDLDLWPWKSIEFQILLRTRCAPSLVKIHWRMLILECSQRCYGRTVALLYPFATSLARG
jgi:hypothetical protein